MAALVACGPGYTGPDAEPDASTQIITGSADHKLPAESLTDWVSYMDQISVVTVISERQIEPDPGDASRGEGLVGREVTLRVERTIWNRDNAPVAEGEITVRAWGWILHDHELIPTKATGSTRIEVGGRYVAPLVQMDSVITDGKVWALLSNGGSTMPLLGDRIVADNHQPERSAAYVRELVGSSVDELAALVHETEPYPVAAMHMDLEPQERFRAVIDEQHAQTSARESN